MQFDLFNAVQKAYSEGPISSVAGFTDYCTPQAFDSAVEMAA